MSGARKTFSGHHSYFSLDFMMRYSLQIERQARVNYRKNYVHLGDILAAYSEAKIRTITPVQTSGNILTFTVAMVTKLAAKKGCIGIWPLWNKFKTFEREINIEIRANTKKTFSRS